MIDNLGNAADIKRYAKQAIKEKRYDDAWSLLHKQKESYINHVNTINSRFGRGFSYIDMMVLVTSPHIDMANILRLEGKHQEALYHLSHHYVCLFKAKRNNETINKKMESYFNRLNLNRTYSSFINKLKKLESVEFVDVRAFISNYIDDNK